jgi:isopentenyl diphosphate isomerase/L-lactate dehydrogenase-like FMN-dependent dehydrogenase
MNLPLYVSATAMGRLYDPQGEKAIARACVRKRIPYMAPTLGSYSIAEVRQAGKEEARKLFGGNGIHSVDNNSNPNSNTNSNTNHTNEVTTSNDNEVTTSNDNANNASPQSPEDLEAATGDASGCFQWFQLYVNPDRKITEKVVKKAEELG